MNKTNKNTSESKVQEQTTTEQVQEQVQPEPAPVQQEVKIPELNSKQVNLLGRSRTFIDNMKKRNALPATIEDTLRVQAETAGIELAIWKHLIENRSASGKKGVNQAVKDYRSALDTRTDNWLFANHAIAHHEGSFEEMSDERKTELLTALRDNYRELLDYDRKYLELTGDRDKRRTDYRGMLILSRHVKFDDFLARYGGGWDDGSPKDRDQYSSGRRVSTAKSTGYTLAQTLPEFTAIPKPEQEKTEEAKS